MNIEIMMGLESARVMQQEYISGDQKKVPSDRVRVSAHQRLARQIHVIVHQVPTRHETLDWLGRRLITWGWQLRMRYGPPRR